MERNNIPENIKFLILKWRSKSLTSEEQDILDGWYEEALPEELYWDGDTEQGLKTKLFSAISESVEEDFNTVVPLKARKNYGWQIAASVAVLFLCLFGALYYSSQHTTSKILEKENVTGSITKVILPDQSIVWLKGNSKLHYPETFTGKFREVELVGEGLFEITKNKDIPFIIRAGDYSTQVLGTSFNLKLDPESGELDLAVLTGKVEVTKKVKGIGMAKRYSIVANEGLKATAKQIQKIEKEVKPEKIENIVRGTEYNMTFVSTPVEEIMSRFEQKFNVSFQGYTGEYNSCRVTADLTDQSLETSLKLLSLSINAQYKITNDIIKLTGGGCF